MFILFINRAFLIILLVIHVDCKRESQRRQPAEVHAHKIASKDRKPPISEEVIEDILKERAENPKNSKEESTKQAEEEAEKEAEKEVEKETEKEAEKAHSKESLQEIHPSDLVKMFDDSYSLQKGNKRKDLELAELFITIQPSEQLLGLGTINIAEE